MSFLSDLAQNASDFVWGAPLIIFLFSANLILVYFSRFAPLRGFFHACKLVWEKKSQSQSIEGQISHFQALSNALAATIGLGNISGVAVAIYSGGAGAVFWMWVTAVFGMNTKFFECALAVMYRGKDYKNQTQGGPMYVISTQLPKRFHFLATFFAICGLIGTLAIFQINQLSQIFHENYAAPRWMIGCFFAALTFFILKGGIFRISAVNSRIVPIMGILYFLTCTTILLLNWELILPTFGQIFTLAFSVESVSGGIAGYALKEVITTGVKRATFSNEAGIGTAPMAHGNVKTNEPISEGYVAMLGPFLDTIIICTLTALVILISREHLSADSNGISLTTLAFELHLPGVGKHFLGISVLLFAFSTMIGMANYNIKCWDFLFQGRRFFGDTTFLIFYCSSIAIGALVNLTFVVNLMDFAFALMAVPNIIATVYLAPKVRTGLAQYNKKHGIR